MTFQNSRGDFDAPVGVVVVLEDRAAEDADFEVVDVDVREDGVFEVSPQSVLGTLVEAVHLWGDVGVGERVRVGPRGFRQAAPQEIGAACDVATVESVALVQLVADLGVGGKPRVLGEGDAGAAEAFEAASVDVPADPEREAAHSRFRIPGALIARCLAVRDRGCRPASWACHLEGAEMVRGTGGLRRGPAPASGAGAFPA